MECTENCGCKEKINRNKDDIQLIWKEINAMKKWVIAGMCGLIAEILIVVVNIALGN